VYKAGFPACLFYKKANSQDGCSTLVQTRSEGERYIPIDSTDFSAFFAFLRGKKSRTGILPVYSETPGDRNYESRETTRIRGRDMHEKG
jgi:hypothetical protein